MRVLLVDDERELVSTMAERLSFRGIDAEWACTCDDALKRVESTIFDLAVLDVKMPKMSGLELKRKLQAKCPGMKFIFMTGHGSKDDFEAGSAETGSEYYLVKPIRIEALIDKIKDACTK
ncbi:MAG: response regulator [Deltaproteobacteria bacterium]|nr:response regulator [Deltaproteobacteria bacterium]RLB96371.1 MAG: response regulator [Deltaproteobacteria bacterium]RLC12764.1 MAG: response regulator [Deltaproteobacteria bacterium]